MIMGHDLSPMLDVQLFTHEVHDLEYKTSETISTRLFTTVGYSWVYKEVTYIGIS